MIQNDELQNLRQIVINCLIAHTGEDILVQQLNCLIEREGSMACQAVLHVLTSLEFSQEEAEESWRHIQAHREKMGKALKRKVNIRSAICDYFCSVDKSLKNPKVVEIQLFEKTLKECNYDGLTGLLNRNSFDLAIERELSLAARYDTEVSLLFFDIDDFKIINDTYGHQTGDLALKLLSKVIFEEKRTGDIAARYGGEEIVILLPYTGRFDALVLGERIRNRIEESIVKHDDTSVRFTISGGLVSYPVDAQDASSLVKNADTAMYRAKGRGKNTIAFFSLDKRRYLRIKHSQSVSVRELGFNEDPLVLEVESKNISMGGLLIESCHPFRIGTKLQLSIPLVNHDPLLVIGTVVRLETIGDDQYDIGLAISFQEMDKLAKKEISQYLSTNIGRHSPDPFDD